jgi:hypothetical protein
MDEKLDAECIALLRKVEQMRRELRDLNTELSRQCTDYGKRRGYYSNFREWHVNNQHELETRLEQAAQRNDWEKANA